ncbi:Beta-barrel assembly-enhancing protease [Pseudoalteromonas holothuriae]|uniref:Beta-barrel assembly-enhancing protease n=1 Tax=Pseudoalteromonas holothuriae TaxID=2963714 RepID=A0A9W4QVX6_9GAMM|nr:MULTISPECIES: M48 family metallopeptidase [unclassified Pseudoalteromonas]CAH9053941.1 Beta-barrel assembly-enhancing protease [Pseudoalteromonas sp. CIP111951]CAH9055682.1 Beta-barrel assembly-enhancing protease [Pseudoalteromonas sp. CIP111854]
MNSSLETRINAQQQKQWLWIIVSALIVVVFAGYQFYTQSIPYLAEKIAAAIPKSIYQAIDENSLTTLDDSELKSTKLSEAKQQELQLLFDKLVKDKADSEREFKLKFRNWNDQANAMALANGTVVITDAMVNLTTDQQELSAVLLHEIGHVEHNHVMESLVSSSIVYVSLSFLLGDISAVSNIALQGTVVGIHNSYSRQAELEADKYALTKLNALYGSDQAIKSVLTKLEKEHNSEFSWLSTHPSFEERIDKIDK